MVQLSNTISICSMNLILCMLSRWQFNHGMMIFVFSIYFTLSLPRSLFQYIYHILFIFALNSQSPTVDISILLYIKTINRRIWTPILCSQTNLIYTIYFMRMFLIILYQLFHILYWRVKSTVLLGNQLSIHFSYWSEIVSIFITIPWPHTLKCFSVRNKMPSWSYHKLNQSIRIPQHPSTSHSRYVTAINWKWIFQCENINILFPTPFICKCIQGWWFVCSLIQFQFNLIHSHPLLMPTEWSWFITHIHFFLVLHYFPLL